MNIEHEYLRLLKDILDNGVEKQDRTGTGTISVFGRQIRHKMSEGFPLLTTKKMPFNLIATELIWFLMGDTNIKYLVDNNCHIWDGDAYKRYYKTWEMDTYGVLEPLTIEKFVEKIKTNDTFAKDWGELGPIYGRQWRNWNAIFDGGVDQIANLINDLKTNPDSRRLMVSAWNVGELDQMVLPPCHYGFQCYTQEMNSYERKMWWCESLGKNISYAEDLEETELDALNVPKRRLSLKWIQRSVDVFLGLPFNIASYGLLLHLLAKEVNMVPNELIFSGGDVHLYTNHIEQAKEQLTRQTFNLSKLELTNTSLDDLKYEDVKILNYQSDKVLKAELSN
jgi:thymidylate synthase